MRFITRGCREMAEKRGMRVIWLRYALELVSLWLGWVVAGWEYSVRGYTVKKVERVDCRTERQFRH